jgi:hypothetical protein
MNTRKILLAALLSCTFAPALAEDEGQLRVENQMVMRGDFNFDSSTFLGPMMRMHGRLVKNAPYSAEGVSERQHNLADGNQITNKTSSLSYRDSNGSTRQEMRDAKGELRTVTIHNVPEGATYILHPADKTATKIAPDREIGRIAGEAARARIEALRKEGKLAAIEHKDGEEIIVKRIERGDRDAHSQIREEVRVRVAPNININPDINVNINPVIAGAFGDMKWAAKATTKELGTREMEGVKAEGKLRSYEIPAGEVGNRNPIVVSDETWYSPELQVTVYSKHSDPRSGDSIYRLANLKREEPAAALFSVPSDYTVKDALANVKKTLVEKK